MPRRWRIPSEKPLTRRGAASTIPVSSSTSETLWRPIPLLWAIDSRWHQALRPGWAAFASRSEPTWWSGRIISW